MPKNAPKRKNKRIGSNLDDFLAEEGLLDEIEDVVAKRIFVFEIESKMIGQNSIGILRFLQ